MAHKEIIKNIILPNLSVGDLVRLNEDASLKVGIGIIEDIKLNFDDVHDLNILLNKIEKYNVYIKSSAEIDGFFPSKAQALVMWTGKRMSKFNSMWMYTSEITVVHKVICHGDDK